MSDRLTEAVELRPCPFCGGKGMIIEVDGPIEVGMGWTLKKIECQGCFAATASFPSYDG